MPAGAPPRGRASFAAVGAKPGGSAGEGDGAAVGEEPHPAIQARAIGSRALLMSCHYLE